MTEQTNHTPQSRRKLALGLCAAVLAAAAGIAWSSPGVLGIGWNSQQTEDAYVEGNLVHVTPQVAGTVTRIAADNTDFVRPGEVLVQLNDVDARLALDRAEAALARSARQVRSQLAGVGQLRSTVVQRESDLARAESDLARRRQLADTGAVSGEDIRHADDAVGAARAALNAARQQVDAALALVDGTTLEQHPDVLASIAGVRDASLGLARTTLAAPVGGIVARRNVQIGQRVAQGAPLMAIVPLDQMWVTANLKETQLKDVRIGQPVAVTSDVYGADVVFHGRVAGQEAGTGSAFAAVPAQNATGNWIKVVQRVPVRIALDAQELARHPLRLGLSMKVAIDTSRADGPSLMQAGAVRHSYETVVFETESHGADAAIRRALGAPAAVVAR
ncbi:membrane fusion protein (multidrug efflux system) [Massilia aurea]|uniref:Membrane fusion protein (Multidrug efflux system) n=1 Tax=Massilia aurea TaxID=373040 RepID=A0A7W9WYT1_9BURK|nr:efflux RND transporter periplasmic adaptor subunit [Massilia aurea]MBB6133313.1 membrane fusion protein (multidrug efflux system) [Massilia aurea]